MTTINDLPSDIITRILRLLDFPSIVAFCDLYSISSQSHLWLHLSLSFFPSLLHPRILPSLSSPPHSFFFDTLPFPIPFADCGPAAADNLPSELISAVDIHNRGAHIFSIVFETDTTSSLFRKSPFLINAMDQKTEPIIVSPEEMTLSWILFDPASGRAANVPSRRAIKIRQDEDIGKTMVFFELVGANQEGVIGGVVDCEEVTGKVCKMVMVAQNFYGRFRSGEEALSIIWGMMKEEKGRLGEEEVKARNLEYLERWKEMRHLFISYRKVLRIRCPDRKILPE